ncbi:MAG: hypothetical protein GX425_06130 [Peptococcaceae bacterium]|nr:hypothetical protein [Peptococcaceae bacterium]
MPVPDLVEAMEYDKAAIWRSIDRSKEVFEGGVVVTTIPSAGGPQKTTCLTRDGVIGLLMKLSTGRIKDPAKRQMIVNFQRWVMRTISEILQEAAGPAQAVQEQQRNAWTEDSGDKTKVFMTMTGLAQQYLSLCEAAMKSSGIDAQAMGAAGELLQGCLNLGMSLLKGDMYSPATVSQCKL